MINCETQEKRVTSSHTHLKTRLFEHSVTHRREIRSQSVMNSYNAIISSTIFSRMPDKAAQMRVASF